MYTHSPDLLSVGNNYFSCMCVTYFPDGREMKKSTLPQPQQPTTPSEGVCMLVVILYLTIFEF